MEIEKRRAYANRYYAEHPKEREAQKQRHRRYNERQKQTVVEHYSQGTMLCCSCGFSDIRALTIDHIDGGGLSHLGQIGKGNLYPWLIKNDFPEGYQVLCMNCNWIKRHENREFSTSSKPTP